MEWQYGVGGQVVDGSFTRLSMEAYERLAVAGLTVVVSSKLGLNISPTHTLID
jgi:phosphate/sulfate permease